MSCPTTRKFLTLGVVEARSKGTNAKCCHDAIFQSTDQLFDGRLRSTTATAGHHEAIAHPAVPALDPNEAFAWTAEHGIQAEAMCVPVGQITADWNSRPRPARRSTSMGDTTGLALAEDLKQCGSLQSFTLMLLHTSFGDATGLALS